VGRKVDYLFSIDDGFSPKALAQPAASRVALMNPVLRYRKNFPRKRESRGGERGGAQADGKAKTYSVWIGRRLDYRKAGEYNRGSISGGKCQAKPC
jgi:hypothetical protein